MKKNNDLNYLTSLRGLAAVLVMLYHTREFLPNNFWLQSFLSKGYLAVDFFFILSGFVISLAYSNRFNGIAVTAFAPQFIQFYIKRCARIFPLHITILLLMLITYSVINVIKGGGFLIGRFSLSEFIPQLFLIQNWFVSSTMAWNIPSWSISTEMFAYLCFPFLLFMMNLRKNISFYIVIGFSLLVLLALIFKQAGADSLGSHIMALGVIRCVIEFSLGMLVYKTATEVKINNIIIFVVNIIMLLLLLLVFVPVANYWYMPLAMSLFLFNAIHAKGLVVLGLSNKTLLWLGEISYSIYLVHYFGKDLMKFSATSLANIGTGHIVLYVTTVIFVSHLTHRFIEIKAQRYINKMFEKT